jgi:hypothetical protein
MRCFRATTVVCCGDGMSRCRSGVPLLKRMVMWRGGGAGGKKREDGLRGRSGRVSRGGLVGEDAEEGDDEQLARPAPLPLALPIFGLVWGCGVGVVIGNNQYMVTCRGYK